MDVKLPDGSILRGVPEGTTKEQILAKLNGNAAFSKEEVGELGGEVTSGEEDGMVQLTSEQLSNRAKLENPSEVPVREQALVHDDKAGGSLTSRMGYGAKMTPEGKAGFVEETDTANRPPIRGQDGKIYVYKDRIGDYVPYNPQGFDLGDVTQAIGENVGTLANLVAGWFTGGSSYVAQVAAQGGAGVANSAIKQGVSALLPGDDKMTLQDRATDATRTAAESMIAQAAILGVVKGVDYMRPHNVVARKYQAATKSPMAKSGDELLTRTKARTGKDFPLTIAEETQDPWLLGMQQAAEKSFSGKANAMQFYNKRLEEAYKLTASTVDDIARGTTQDAGQFGDLVRTKFTRAVDEAFDAAYAQAKVDYAPFVGNKTPVQMTNFRTKLSELAESYTPLRTSMKKGVQIGGQTIKDNTGSMSVSHLVDSRRILSNSARGKAKLFEGLDPGQEKIISRELVKALEKDLEGAEGLLGEQLKTANRNYFANMQTVRGMKSTVLGSLLKTDKLKPGETITDALMKAKPSQLEAVFKISNMDSPEVWQGLKAQYGQRLLEEGEKGAAQMAPGLFKYNPRTAAQALNSKYPGMSVVFKDRGERQALQDVIDINHRVAQFMPDPMPGSTPGQQLSEVAPMVGAAAGGRPSFTAIAAPRWITKWFYGGTASKMMFDPVGQKALRTLATTEPGTKQFMAAVAYTMERTMKEPSESEVSSQLENER